MAGVPANQGMNPGGKIMGRSKRLHCSDEGIVNGEWCGGLPLPELDSPNHWERRGSILVPKGCPGDAEIYFLQLLKALGERNGSVSSEVVLSGDHGDLVDQAFSQIARSMASAQHESQSVEINRIDTALRLMAVGWNGKKCLNFGCRCEIPEARRLAVPGTMFCATCKAALERQCISTIELRFDDRYSHSLQPAAA